MGADDVIDFGKIFLIAGVSVLAGVFLGSRTGGTYTFEVGVNLADILFFSMVLLPILFIFYMIYSYYMLKLKKIHEYNIAIKKSEQKKD